MRKEQDVVSGARRIAHSIMSLTRANLDRSWVARILWESCGIPSILYAVEAMTLSKQTVGAIERIQTEIGNFILQTPRSTSKLLSWTEAGLMPFKYRIWMKVAVYYWRILNKKKDPILKGYVKEVQDQGADDPWIKLILEIEGEIGTPIEGLRLKELKEKVIERAVIFVLDEKREHVSLRSQPQPSEWFRLQKHVNDSRCSMVLNMARSGNLLLGNRMQNKFGKQWKMCPGCRKIGQDFKLDEGHVILRCPLVSRTR